MHTDSAKLAAAILAEVSKALRSNDDQRIAELHAKVFGRAKRRLLPTRKEPASGSSSEVAAYFSNFETRDHLATYLKDAFPTKSELAVIARQLAAPVTKADTYDSLLSKIIDSTVGYRLRAETIRGRNARR